MTSKLNRRVPLFGIDSGFKLVSPIKPKGVFQMECEVSHRTNGNSPGSKTKSSPAVASAGSTKSQLHVEFIDNGEVKEKREKYLTAKYGSHQMSLIRKRLAVEMWLYDELQKLFDTEEGVTTNHDVEIDMDEILDLDGDVERRKFLKSLLSDAKKSQEAVNKFIDDLLEKAKTL